MAHIENAALRGGWHHKGFYGRGNVEELLDSLTGRPALVCGSGRGVFDEVAEAEGKFCVAGNPALIFACNDVGLYLHHVDHLISLHAYRLELWSKLRGEPTSKPYGNLDYKMHDAGLGGSSSKFPWYHWQGLTPTMAFSGMFAAQIAYLMGCAPIVLCGIPQDSTPRFFERSTRGKHVNGQEQIKAESRFKPEFKAAIRSMSGFTREWFGAPEW